MMVVAKGLVRERRTPVMVGASSLQSRSMRRILEFRAAQEENMQFTLSRTRILRTIQGLPVRCHSASLTTLLGVQDMQTMQL